MKVNVVTLENKQAGDIVLSADVFGLPVRLDLIQRMVRWQLAKAQSGTHSTKGISAIRGTTAKPHRQKGTGSARAGSKRSPQFRGGAVIFGPVPRSHAHDLPKKVRKLALKTMLSSKLAEGKLLIIDDASVQEAKTSKLNEKLKIAGWNSVLIISAGEGDENLKRAVSNLKHVDILPQVGANVYDILRHDNILLTKEAVKELEERL